MKFEIMYLEQKLPKKQKIIIGKSGTILGLTFF